MTGTILSTVYTSTTYITNNMHVFYKINMFIAFSTQPKLIRSKAHLLLPHSQRDDHGDEAFLHVEESCLCSSSLADPLHD
jgi:hypothetical protein